MYIPETYGSSAYAPTFSEPRREVKRTEKKVSEKKRTVTWRAKKLALISAAWVFAVLFLVRFAIIAEQCRQIEILNTQLAEANSAVVQEQLKLNKEINLSYIEEYASAELGMVRPSADQEVYITIHQDDQSEVLQVAEKPGFFASIGNRIFQLLEYLN